MGRSAGGGGARYSGKGKSRTMRERIAGLIREYLAVAGRGCVQSDNGASGGPGARRLFVERGAHVRQGHEDAAVGRCDEDCGARARGEPCRKSPGSRSRGLGSSTSTCPRHTSPARPRASCGEGDDYGRSTAGAGRQGGRRILVPEHRQAVHRRAPPVDHNRRRYREHPVVCRVGGRAGQPPGRLGDAVRQDDLRHQGVGRRGGRSTPTRSRSTGCTSCTCGFTRRPRRTRRSTKRGASGSRVWRPAMRKRGGCGGGAWTGRLSSSPALQAPGRAVRHDVRRELLRGQDGRRAR